MNLQGLVGSDHRIVAISFDVWSTLIKHNPHFKEARMQAIADVLGVRNDSLLHTVFAHVDDEYDLWTNLDGQQYGFRPRVTEIVRRLHVPELADGAYKELQERLETAILSTLPMLMENDLLDTLYRLAQKYRLGIISNTGFLDGSVMWKVLDALGIMDHMILTVFSSDVHVAKPNQGIYTALAQGLGVPLHCIVHVGDNPVTDYTGAIKAGMHAVLLKNPADTSKVCVARLSDLLRY